MSEEEIENVKCRICGNAGDNKTYAVREMMFGTRESFRYVQCAACGCLQIAEIPPDMSRYYPAGYYSFNLSPQRAFAHRLKNFIKRPRYRYAVLNRGILGRLLYLLFPNKSLRRLSHVRLTEDSRILDVGCGTGSYLYWLRTIGLTHLLGIDPYIEKDIEYDNGLRIVKTSLHELEGTWDLIMFNASLEHMPDQLGTLTDAARLLEDGGTCLVRIPMVSSYAWEHYGVNWVQLDAPRHLYLHSVRSLTLVAERAGLTIDRTLHDSTEFQFWGSEQYVRSIPLVSERSWSENPSRSIFSPADIRTFRRRAEDLNRQGRGDQGAFYLKKG